MKNLCGIKFWYFGELFILLHLTGLTHASWWWLVLFYGVDIGKGLSFYNRDLSGRKEQL